MNVDAIYDRWILTLIPNSKKIIKALLCRHLDNYDQVIISNINQDKILVNKFINFQNFFIS